MSPDKVSSENSDSTIEHQDVQVYMFMNRDAKSHNQKKSGLVGKRTRIIATITK